jgi:hypothetical protein
VENLVLVIGIGLLVVWYFGRVINGVVKGAGEMASVEFEMLKDEQAVRVAKQYSDLGNRLEKVLEEATHTKASVKSLIKNMNHHEEEK